MPKERYEDLLDFRLKQLDKSKKAQREASSFYIVTSNNNGKMSKYYSFEKIPIEIRHNKDDFEIMKIRYELLKRSSQKSPMTAPRIVWRTGYSFYEKLIYTNLIRRGYKEHEDFEHLYKIGDVHVLDFAFIKEKLNVECEGESWHEKCRKPEEAEKMELFLNDIGWKVLRVNFSSKDIKGSLTKALKKINLEIKKIRNQHLL